MFSDLFNSKYLLQRINGAIVKRNAVSHERDSGFRVSVVFVKYLSLFDKSTYTSILYNTENS